MHIAGYEIVIGIWDIISLLLPVGIAFMYFDFKQKHKRRMKRLEIIDENAAKEAEGPSNSKRANEEMIDILVDKNI